MVVWVWLFKMAAYACNILRRTAHDISQFDERSIPTDVLDCWIISLEFVYRELIVLDTCSQLDGLQRNGLGIVRECILKFKELLERSVQSYWIHPTRHLSGFGFVGRPSYDIPYQQMLFLIEHRFSVPQIADMLGVSVRTIRRRMTTFGLSIRAQYSNISDQELDDLVQDIQQQFPMCGNKQMQGHLLHRGFRVQQTRIRDSQRRVDPSGSAIRRLHILNRREYCVPAPLSLYHIDGYHKLIRFVS